MRKELQELADVSGTPTHRATVDAGGSTVDSIFAEAVESAMPTIVAESIVMVKEVPNQHDAVTFPVLQNFDLSWTDISGTGSDLGSEVSVTAGPAITWKKVTPVLYTAGIFVPDAVDLLVNKADFELYAKLGGISVQKKIDQDTLNVIMDHGNTDANARIAGGFSVGTGSISASSTLTPQDLLDARTTMTVGSNPYTPDTILIHPTQYNDLISHQDFSLTQTTDARNKAVWQNGTVVSFDRMNIVQSELVNAGAGDTYAVAGHPVAVMNSKISAALAKKSAGFKVTTIDDRLKHGKFKVFDIMFAASVLVSGSIIIIRAAD